MQKKLNCTRIDKVIQSLKDGQRYNRVYFSKCSYTKTFASTNFLCLEISNMAWMFEGFYSQQKVTAYDGQ